jgi:hypothetical protein
MSLKITAPRTANEVLHENDSTMQDLLFFEITSCKRSKITTVVDEGYADTNNIDVAAMVVIISCRRILRYM